MCACQGSFWESDWSGQQKHIRGKIRQDLLVSTKQTIQSRIYTQAEGEGSSGSRRGHMAEESTQVNSHETTDEFLPGAPFV